VGAAACLKAHEYIIAETIEYTGKRKASPRPSSTTRPSISSSRNADRSRTAAALIYRAAEALVAART